MADSNSFTSTASGGDSMLAHKSVNDAFKWLIIRGWRRAK